MVRTKSEQRAYLDGFESDEDCKRYKKLKGSNYEKNS